MSMIVQLAQTYLSSLGPLSSPETADLVSVERPPLFCFLSILDLTHNLEFQKVVSTFF